MSFKEDKNLKKKEDYDSNDLKLYTNTEYNIQNYYIKFIIKT